MSGICTATCNAMPNLDLRLVAIMTQSDISMMVSQISVSKYAEPSVIWRKHYIKYYSPFQANKAFDCISDFVVKLELSCALQDTECHAQHPFDCLFKGVKMLVVMAQAVQIGTPGL